MKDMQAQLEKLREQAAEFTRIASRATDAAKQELFTRLAEHFLVLGRSDNLRIWDSQGRANQIQR
jgi:hypothetical protein